MLILIVMLMSFTLIKGCSPKEDEIIVGIILPTKDEPRWVQDEARFKELFNQKGYNATILFSQANSAKEKSNVEYLINKL